MATSSTTASNAHDGTLSAVAARAPFWVRQSIKQVSNLHRPNGLPDVFIFSIPRSGSTWLTELIWSQPGFKCCDEPTDLRNPLVQKHLGLHEWTDFYDDRVTARIESYFQGFQTGRLRFMNPSLLRQHYRPVTHRMVFKVIHGYEDRIAWFQECFNARVVLLLRHPIAVSLSREGYPSLRALIYSDYRRHFSSRQISYAEEIYQRGTKLQQGVTSWCLQNAVPLREATDDWAIVTYEQLSIDPLPVVQELCGKLLLPEPERIRSQLHVPSNSTRKSDAVTRSRLTADTQLDRHWFVDKWREKVTPAEERDAMEILERFDLDAYTVGTSLPARRLWLGSTDIHPDANRTMGR